jgi:hypothetical protein
MRRAAHPEALGTPAVTPEAIEVARQAPHAADNGHPVQQSAAATIQAEANGKDGVWRHGDCPVNHRSAEAAAKCRNR